MSSSSAYKSYDDKELSVGSLVYTIFIDPVHKDYHIKEYRVIQLVTSTNMIVIELTTDGTQVNVVKADKVHTNPATLAELWVNSMNNDIKELNKRIAQLNISVMRYIDKEITI